MGNKIKNIKVLLIIAGLATGAWMALSYGELKNLTVNTKPPRISMQPTPIDEPQEEPQATEPEVVITKTNPSNPKTEVTQEPVIPEPAERKPATVLSEEILEELGIDEPIEEEQVFYATATTPNDPIYPQWYTTIIDAPDAWDTSTGSGDTLVAVLDTGFALDHEDLASAWFINDGEQGTTQAGDMCWTGVPADKQTNACDDEGNGYIDDWKGWDFAGNDNNAQTQTDSAVGSSHGTMSAGFVGARGNNSIGVASVNWQTKILPVQVLLDEGYGYSTDIAGGIYYAVLMGADVINMSLGGPAPDSFTLAAVKYAELNNVIVVVSAGNCGDGQSTGSCIGYVSPGGMGYPARYPETIAVGATTSSDTQASFSSWGDELTIAAPGSGSLQVPSWTSSNATSAYSASAFGTSFASPIVAGALAILKADMPELTTSEAVAILANSSDKVAGMNGSDWTQRYGWGRLNVNNMLTELAKYKTQLLKGGGQISKQTGTTKPQISTNTGHTSATEIPSGSTVIRTYCVTTPNTQCSLSVNGPNQLQAYFETQLSNSQGIAVFEWTRGSGIAGTYEAVVVSNSQTSTAEHLIFQ